MRKNRLRKNTTPTKPAAPLPAVSKISMAIILVLLIAIFPIIALWKANLGEVPSSVVFLPMLVTILFILASYGIWILISRSLEKAAILTAVFSIIVLTFGHVYNMILGKTVFGFPIGFLKLLAVYLVLFIVAVVFLFKVKFKSYSFLLYADILTGILILFNLIPIIIYSVQARGTATGQTPANTAITDEKKKPDIYYIVLDSYARDDILRDVIGFDNSDFLNSLRERGFFIPKCSYSNYDGTLRTISSVLNTEYLDTLGISMDFNEENHGKEANLVLHSKIIEQFKSFGYTIVTGRGFNSSLDILDSDMYFNVKKNKDVHDDLAQQQFNGLYASTTILRVLMELSADNPEAYAWVPYWLAGNKENNASLEEASFWYNQNNLMFESMEKLPEAPGSYFVYAHIIAPHGPYAYRGDGSFNYPPDSNDEKTLYSDSLRYLDKRVIELVDSLITKSTILPIIIIEGDHGIHKLTSGLDLHKNLSAFYLPGDLSTPPYDTITPVNDFRLILKNYFDPSVNLLPDTLWVKFTNDYESVPASCELQP